MRYGPTISMVGTPFSISPSCGGFSLHCLVHPLSGAAVVTRARQEALSSILGDKGGSIAQNAVPGQCKRSPHHAKWAGAGELYAEREDRFWKPVSLRMRRCPGASRSFAD